ncbi:MAG TPA: cupin domain-containing protein [Gemmatimonadales bacterium]|nr:cupin domain-containing protein [Gemmatimonadales bacterium]
MGTRLLAAVAVSVTVFAPNGVSAQTASHPARLRWQVPTLMPPGALFSIVKGDPTAPGECTLQLSLPNGYRIPPHYHPGYEHVEVREGTLLVGMGDSIDTRHARAMAPGDSATAPAGMHHWSVAEGRTVLLVTFNGPYTITYVRAEDAPRTRSFPFDH